MLRITNFNIEESLGFLLSKAQQLSYQNFREKLTGYNLTPPQFGTLGFLWQQDGLTQVQLGTRMQMDRTTMSGIIDRLEKEGLVIRKNNPQDRRAHLLFLTKKGTELENTLSILAHQTNLELSSPLSESERVLLISLLKRILIKVRECE